MNPFLWRLPLVLASLLLLGGVAGRIWFSNFRPSKALDQEQVSTSRVERADGAASPAAVSAPRSDPPVIFPALGVPGVFTISSDEQVSELVDLLNDGRTEEEQVEGNCSKQAIGISGQSLVVLKPCGSDTAHQQALVYTLRTGQRPLLETIKENDRFTHVGYISIGPRLPAALLLASRGGNRGTHHQLALLLRDQRSGRLYDAAGDIGEQFTVWTLVDLDGDGTSEVVSLEQCGLRAYRLSREGARYELKHDARFSASRIERAFATAVISLPYIDHEDYWADLYCRTHGRGISTTEAFGAVVWRANRASDVLARLIR